jgi:hypothetical protein
MKKVAFDLAVFRLFLHASIPPGLRRSPFLLASSSATINFGINQWSNPQSTDIIGLPIHIEKYWGLILIFAAAVSLLGLLLPKRWNWDWFFRIGLWAMFAAWSFTAIILFYSAGGTTYISGFLAVSVAVAAVVDILKLDILVGTGTDRGDG